MDTGKDTNNQPTRPTLCLTAFLSLAVLSLAMLCLPPGISSRLSGIARLFTEPAQTFSAMRARAARGALGGFQSKTERNDFLAVKTEAVEAQAELADLLENTANLEKENKILRNRLNFIASSKALSLTLCEVLSRDPYSEYYDYITINRGSGDGVKKGCHILSEKGLIGVVTEAGINSAKVMLATSRDFSMPCNILSKNVYGLLQGTGTENSGELSMVQPVPQIVVNSLDGVLFDTVAVGDQVTVSATGEAGGHGIVVGIVSKVDASLAGAPVLSITPAATFNQLKYVFAVIGKESPR